MRLRVCRVVFLKMKDPKRKVGKGKANIWFIIRCVCAFAELFFWKWKIQKERLEKGKPIFDLSLDAFARLQSCFFENERSIVQELVEIYGHIYVKSPKCHPELAGVGIEYSWGKGKWYFRRNNDPNKKN